MKKKILWKLAVLFTMVLMLFTAVMGIVFFYLFRRHTEEVNQIRMENRAVSVAETIASFEEGIGHEAEAHGTDGGDIYLEFLDELALEEIWVLDNVGINMTTSHQHEEHQKPLPDDAQGVIQKVLQEKKVFSEGSFGAKNDASLIVGAPIILTDGSLLGVVLLQSPMSGLNDALKYGLWALFIGSAAAMVFSVTASVFVAWYFTAPLGKMKDTALKLAEGEYTAKTNIHQEDEIGELADTMDLLSMRLLEAKSERETLDRLREEFIANVSHELRTPVAVLRGSLEVLWDKTVEEPEEVFSYYKQMLLESRHMERLVNDLLDLSRLQNEGFVLEQKETDLMDVVRDAMRAIRRAASKKQLSVIFEGEEDSYEIWGDYVRIRQMLLILLDNAVKFANEGTSITVGLHKTAEGYGLWVKDEGAVISEDEMPHIFERFHKIQSAQNEKGTGLGLPIAKQIAIRHHAIIQVESNSKETKFSILFPEAKV